MLRRDFWGKRYATEGARAAIRFAFSKLDKPRVISLLQPGNDASIRVAERLGEQPDGQINIMGQEVLIFSISREH